MRKRLTILAHFPFEPWPIRALCLTFGPTVSFGCMPSRRPRASSRSPPSSFPKCFSLIGGEQSSHWTPSLPLFSQTFHTQQHACRCGGAVCVLAPYLRLPSSAATRSRGMAWLPGACFCVLLLPSPPPTFSSPGCVFACRGLWSGMFCMPVLCRARALLCSVPK